LPPLRRMTRCPDSSICRWWHRMSWRNVYRS